MKTSITLYIAISMAGIIFMPLLSIGQNLEVVGQAKITVMTTDNTAQNIVVKQPDGTLAVRDALTFYGQSVGNYGTVVNPITGKVWLDRNLGATQVATNSTDADSYGDLYQWGRGADGHQVSISDTYPTQATTWLAGSGDWSGKFIIGFTNWLNPAETHMWSGTSAENNPCPSGFRIPTNAEWEQERLTWSPNNDSIGAFMSPLKLPVAGSRHYVDGMLHNVGSFGHYWSSTSVGSTHSRGLFFTSSTAYLATNNRGAGLSVRCIKD